MTRSVENHSEVAKLKEITTKIGSGATPRGGKESYIANGISLIRSLNVYDFHFEYEGLAFIDERQADELSNVEVKSKDILLNITGASVARCCMVPNRILPARVNQHVSIVRINQGRADPYYVLYCINSPKYKRHLLNLAQGGATREALTKDTISEFKIPFPSLPVQHKLGAILSAYDDLIENNSRRIEILEGMARAIYHEWFINFQFPGAEDFRTVSSDLGPLPEGWIGKFPAYVDFLEGPGLRNWQYRADGIPFLNIRTLIANDIDMGKVQFLDPEEVRKKYSHFLLQAYDHVVSSSGTLGRIVTIQKCHLPLMLNTSIIRMRPKTEAVGKWQLKHFLQSDYFQAQIHAHATGVAQVNYGPSHLKEMHIIVPTKEIGRQYEELVSPLEELICNLVRKNSNLRRTRDLLLPKLISGELDVSKLAIDTTNPDL